MSIPLRICATLLALTISACSSGSSDEAISQNNSTDETVEADSDTTAASETLEAAQPLDDDALAGNFDEEQETVEELENEQEQDAEVDESSDDGSGEVLLEEEVLLGEEEEEATDAEQAADEDTSQSEETVENEEDTTNVDSEEAAEVETQDATPDTPVSQLTLRIRTLNARTLMALNQSLSQGELFSDQQQRCLGGFDPAVGEPLLAINCERALATGTIPIYSTVASLNDTEQCRSSIQDTSVAPSNVNCTVNQADITVSTLWTIPDIPDALVARPRPTIGSQVSYNIETNVLRLENLEDELSGSYSCDYDITSEALISSSGASDCNSLINGAIDLIDTYLDNET